MCSVKGEGLEKLTCGKYTQSGVQLRGAQSRNSAAPERSTYMPSADDIRIQKMILELNPDVREMALEILIELLASQQTSSCFPASIGEPCP